jgi:acid phosphatase (class A)
MKKSWILNLLWTMLIVPVLAQQPKRQLYESLDEVRGHYKQLMQFSPLPQSPNEDADQLRFPFDAASAEKRLSLKPVYLTDVSPDDFNIPDPPANSSAQTRAELNYLLGLQKHRTDDDERSALHKAGVYFNPRVQPSDSNYQVYRRHLFYIGRSIGTWFNPYNLPVTADFMARVWQDASYFIWSLKYKYLRVRPYVLEPALHNLEETNWAAYPSGHAANSYINAYIYQELAPQFRDVFIKDAYDMAHSREIIGVHYPSDSEASRIFAREFVNRLFRNENFQRDFLAVKKEWAERAREDFKRPEGNAAKNKTTTCAKTCE